MTTSDRDGRPLFLRDSRYARKFWGLDGYFMPGRSPRHAFQFWVKFNLTDVASAYLRGDLASWQNGVSFKVKQADKPNIQIDTETLHQYNKKRVIQTKLEYQPISITFWDSADDAVLRLWAEYYRYYFGDGRKVTPSSWEYDVTKGDFVDNENNGWGFSPPLKGPNSTNFFSSIEIYHMWGQKVWNRYDIVNPKITSMQQTQNNYEVSDGNEITFQFDYEGVVYNFPETNVRFDAELAEELGLRSQGEDFGDFYTPTQGNGAQVSAAGDNAGQIVEDGLFGDGLLGGILPGGLNPHNLNVADVLGNVASGALDTAVGDFVRTGEVDFGRVTDTAKNSALSGFGNYVFGDGNLPFTITENPQGKLARIGQDIATDFIDGAVAVSKGGSSVGVQSATSRNLQGTRAQARRNIRGISPTAYNAAKGVVQGQGGSEIQSDTIAGVFASAERDAGNVVDSVTDFFSGDDGQAEPGLNMTDAGYTTMNAARPTSSQQGVQRASNQQQNRPSNQTDASLVAELGDAVDSIFN